MKLVRRKILRYILSLPASVFVYSKTSSACSNPYPVYVSKNNVFGSESKNKTEYLKKMHSSFVQDDTKNSIHLKIGNTENEKAIPFSIRISNLLPHEKCRKIDIYAESTYKERVMKESSFYYKIGAYNFYENTLPYISSRFRAIGKGDYVKVIAVATIQSKNNKYLIQSESSAFNLNRCNPYIPVETDETAFKNNECIEARGWLGHKWTQIQQTSFCKKLYESIGWEIRR